MSKPSDQLIASYLKQLSVPGGSASAGALRVAIANMINNHMVPAILSGSAGYRHTVRSDNNIEVIFNVPAADKTGGITSSPHASSVPVDILIDLLVDAQLSLDTLKRDLDGIKHPLIQQYLKSCEQVILLNSLVDTTDDQIGTDSLSF